MKKLQNFLYSLSEEIIPPFDTGKKLSPSKFAMILGDKTPHSSGSIRQIQQNVGLEPIFISLRNDGGFDVSRQLSRFFGSKLIMPRSYEEFSLAVSRCAFCVSDSVEGAIFSLFSHTPSYLNIESSQCRSFIGEIAARGRGHPLVLPYRKNRTDKIKKVGVRDSDFFYVLNGMRKDVGTRLKELFTP